MKIVIATTNQGKLREMQQLLAPLECDILSLADFPTLIMPPEDGSTMQENAHIKAVHCQQQLQLPCLADDSGIEVRALNGEPGIHSARWHPGSDDERNAALLARLENVPPSKRAACFRCALCLAWNDSKRTEVDGVCEGNIALQPRGDQGFGYDPIFEITAQTGAAAHFIGKTMAELPSDEKAKLSHRARAVQHLLAVLKSTF